MPLSVVSSRYQIVQPREILEFHRDLTEVSGFELETAGVLKDGKKLWALARTGQSVALKGKDQVNGYLLLATACDGTLATTAQFTSVRVVCQNTLQIALGDSAGAVKVPHRSQFDAQAVKRQLGIAISSWDGFMVRMKALAERKVSHTVAEIFFRRVLTYPAAGPNMPVPATNDSAIKAVQALYAGRGKGATLPSASNTAWGLPARDQKGVCLSIAHVGRGFPLASAGHCEDSFRISFVNAPTLLFLLRKEDRGEIARTVQNVNNVDPLGRLADDTIENLVVAVNPVPHA